MGNNFGNKNYIKEQIEEIDVFIANQEYETVKIGTNGNTYFSTFDSNNELSVEHTMATTFLANLMRQLKSSDFLPDYNILMQVLQIIFEELCPKNALIDEKTRPQQPFIFTRDMGLLEKRFCQSLFIRHWNGQGMNIVFSRLKSEFRTIGLIGKGAFGVVVRAVNYFDEKEYAIKKIKLRMGFNWDKVLREVRVLAKLEHKNIVRYYSAWVDYETEDQLTSNKAESQGETSSNLESDVFPNSSDNLQDIPEKPDEDIFECDGESCSYPESVNTDNSDNSDEVHQKKTSFNSSESEIFVFADSSSNKSNSHSNGTTNSNNIVPTSNSLSLFKPNTSNFCNLKSQFSSSLSRTPIQEVQPIIQKCEPKPELIPILCIQLELCETSLKEWLIRRNTQHTTIDELSNEDIYTANRYNTQLFEGLHYLHKEGYIHRDINPNNILLTHGLKVLKIVDFGLCKEVINEAAMDNHSVASFASSRSYLHTFRIGTHPYVSPEQSTSSEYTYKTDIFSSALVMLQLYYPFTTDSERLEIISQVKMGRIPEEFRLKYSLESKLISEMVNRDWEKRPSAIEILNSLLEKYYPKDDHSDVLWQVIAELEGKRKTEQDKLF